MNTEPDFIVVRASNGALSWPDPNYEGEMWEVHEAKERDGRLGEMKAAESVILSLLEAMDWRYDKHESVNITVRIEHGSKHDEPPIRVWSWRDTPSWAKSEIADQDDVDWVALVPEWYQIPSWLESTAYGSAKIEHYKLNDETIVVGHHA